MSAPQDPPARPRYAIIGGGITGLTAAFRLTQLLPSAGVELFEAGDCLGGVLRTHRDGPLLIERGADSFINKLPWAVELCQELGLADQLIPTNEGDRRALVLHAGRLHPVPAGFVVMKPQRLGPLLRSPLLSWRGKIRILAEPWIARAADIEREDYDESVASFATRRLGREAFERLVQPLLAGIYTADPDQLSLAATMPDAIEAERRHGSLRAAIRAAGDDGPADDAGARYASFVTLRGGVGQLVDALAGRLPTESIRRNSLIQELSQAANQQWTVVLADGSPCGPFDGVIVAAPAPRTAKIIEPFDAQLAALVAQISYASSAVVSLVFQREQIADPLRGFGFVVPTIERRQIVAASFSSVKFAGRAPRDQVLARVFVGGALQPEFLQLDDDHLCALAQAELSEILKIRGAPRHIDLVRWEQKMPQYHVGHLQLVDRIEERVAQHVGLEFAGNAYRGVGIPQCVHSGDDAARRLACRRD